MNKDRYSKRKVKVLEKSLLSSKLLRIYFKVDNAQELPNELIGRHIKLFPFDDDYMKSYTVSSFDKNVMSLDIHLHLKGRASIWASECDIDDEAVIWGPKKEHSDPINLNSDNVLLVCDLTGFSTMMSLIPKMKESVRGDLIIQSNNLIDLSLSTNINISFVESLDLDLLAKKIKKYDDIFVILGIEDIKYLNSKIEAETNIRLKAYWK